MAADRVLLCIVSLQRRGRNDLVDLDSEDASATEAVRESEARPWLPPHPLPYRYRFSSPLPIQTPTSFHLSVPHLLPLLHPSISLADRQLSFSSKIVQDEAQSEGSMPNLGLESAALVEKSQEIASTGDDGVSTIISVLLFVAFVGLSVLTIGVIYIAVTDFLQKREKEKFEKEEAANKKSGKKKKVKVKAKAGPRGFGQKVEQEED
ncbi:hypothetical protein SDJN02_02188, partial [Cucurbita argyrosperma subsp. argyrosperma]